MVIGLNGVQFDKSELENHAECLQGHSVITFNFKWRCKYNNLVCFEEKLLDSFFPSLPPCAPRFPFVRWG